MTGGIYEKKGKYYIVITTKDENGKWKNKWIPTGLDVKNNKRKAESMLKETLKQYSITEKKEKSTSEDESGNASKVLPGDNKLSNSKLTPFADVINDWLLSIRTEGNIEKNTFQFYDSLCKNHILPYFTQKQYYIEEITTEVLQRFFDEEESNGNRHDSSKPLSASSLKHIKIALNQTIKYAIKKRIINYNPCQFVKLPKKEKTIPRFYNETQLRNLFETIKGEDIYPLVYVTVMYGLRRSEVLGLKWDSVDFENKTVTIKHTVVRFSEVIEKDSTKTKSSYRTYPLPPEIEILFKRQKERERKGMSIFGEEYQQNDYIFKWDYGKPYAPDFITRRFQKILIKNKLPVIRFHDLRHSCASLLLSKGFTLKDIQEWLGHSDIEITANIYTHLDQARKKSIMSSIGI